MKKRVFVGIDIGGTNIKIAAAGLDKRVYARGSIPTLVADGPAAAFERVADALPAIIGNNTELQAAGVGCAGLVDHERGWLHVSPNLPTWRNTPLARIAKRRLGVYTVVDNDANLAAWAEYVLGTRRGRGTFVCLTLGTGVGGAVIIDGRPLRGQNNFAGEIGHTTICEDGPLCSCGNHGCLEAYLGAWALARDARERLRSGKSRYLSRWVERGDAELTPRLIAEAAGKGDRIAKAVYDEAGAHLGTAVANLIHIFNPHSIAIAGAVAKSLHLMKPAMIAEVKKRTFGEARRNVKVGRAVLGKNAAAIGAALMALRQGGPDASF